MILLVAVPCTVVKNCHQLKESVFLMDSGLQPTFDVQNAYLCGCVKVLPERQHITKAALTCVLR